MPLGPWKFISQIKKHTQDGPNLVQLMKNVGQGRKVINAIDVGCGDGIIAFEILNHRRATHVTAIDVDLDAIKVCKINLASDIAKEKVTVLKKTAQSFFKDSGNFDHFDRFVINPPFFPTGSGRENKSIKDQWARHEARLSLKTWVKGARALLKTGGELYCVFPTERLSELLSELSKNKVEPKEIWWLKSDLRKRRFFLRAVRNGKPGLTVHFDFPLKA